MHEVRFEAAARRQFDALSNAVARRIETALDRLRVNPRPQGTLKLRQTRRTLYRLRVGDFRIIYEVRDKELLVLVVEVVRRNERSYHDL